MNIFVTDECPFKSAEALDDKRVNKMILECCQMLTTALRERGCPEDELPVTKANVPYRSTHKNHPCTLWAGRTYGNYRWLSDHMWALCDEFRKRFGHTHVCELNMQIIVAGGEYIPKGALEPFQNSSLFPGMEDTCQAYKNTLIIKWQHRDRNPRWSNAQRPDWYANCKDANLLEEKYN